MKPACSTHFWGIVFCLLLTNSLSAQSGGDYTGSVSALKAKYPKTEIVAVSWKEEFSFSLNTKNASTPKVEVNQVVSEVLVPVKDFAKCQDAVFYSEESSIENIRAFSVKNKNIKLQRQCQDYESDGIFYSDAKVCVISLPLEEKGTALNYGYEVKFKDVKYLTSVYFQEQWPVDEKTLVFNVPDWLDVDLREFNFSGYSIDKEVQKDATQKITKYIYHLQHIPALHSEYHSPNPARTSPHIIVVSKSFTDNGHRTVLFESVKDLYAWYHSLANEIGNKPEDLKPVVTQLTKDKKTDIEKIESMYYYVQDKVRYVAFENGIMGFKPEAAQTVFKNKYGDCKGKANLLTQMLKIAGYDARLTWIGTSDLPYDYSLPSLAVDNHMISTLVLNGKHYFLDGTEENIAFNDYASRIQGKQVLIEDGSNYLLDRIPEFPAERNKEEKLLKVKLDNDALTGNCIFTYNGEAKINLVGAYSSLRNDNKKDALTDFLRSNNSNLVISNIHNPDWENRQKPLQVGFEVKANNQVTKAGGELYVNLDWEKELGGFEFDSTRKTDYELSHKILITTAVEFTIPDGYKVDYLPEALNKKSADLSFEGAYTTKGNLVSYNKKIVINKTIIRKQDFTDWNTFISAINKFYNDQVVLVKK